MAKKFVLEITYSSVYWLTYSFFLPLWKQISKSSFKVQLSNLPVFHLKLFQFFGNSSRKTGCHKSEHFFKGTKKDKKWSKISVDCDISYLVSWHLDWKMKIFIFILKKMTNEIRYKIERNGTQDPKVVKRQVRICVT